MNGPTFELRYGPAEEQFAEVWLPETGPWRPPVFVVHGGYWRAKHDRGYLAPMCAELAGLGYPCVNIEYRRGGQPGGGWPGTRADVELAVRSLPGMLEAAGVSSGGAVLLGHSAGGHLVLLAAYEGIAGVLALAAVTDLAETARARLDGAAAQEFMGGEPEELSEAYAAADPLRLPAPPSRVVLVHGDRDDRVPVEFSRRYAAHAGARLHEVAGADHFELVRPGSAAWPVVLDALTELRG